MKKKTERLCTCCDYYQYQLYMQVIVKLKPIKSETNLSFYRYIDNFG